MDFNLSKEKTSNVAHTLQKFAENEAKPIAEVDEEKPTRRKPLIKWSKMALNSGSICQRSRWTGL